MESESIDDIRLNTLKAKNDARTNERDALFAFRAIRESNQSFRGCEHHNVWRYPMRVRLNGPSCNEQSYRKHQRPDKHGSCFT